MWQTKCNIILTWLNHTSWPAVMSLSDLGDGLVSVCRKHLRADASFKVTADSPLTLRTASSKTIIVADETQWGGKHTLLWKNQFWIQFKFWIHPYLISFLRTLNFDKTTRSGVHSPIGLYHVSAFALVSCHFKTDLKLKLGVSIGVSCSCQNSSSSTWATINAYHIHAHWKCARVKTGNLCFRFLLWLSSCACQQLQYY